MGLLNSIISVALPMFFGACCQNVSGSPSKSFCKSNRSESAQTPAVESIDATSTSPFQTNSEVKSVNLNQIMIFTDHLDTFLVVHSLYVLN